LALLRYPELVKDLGERRFHLQKIQAIRSQFPDCRISPDIVLAGFELKFLALGSHVTLSAGTVLAFGDQTNGFGRIQVGNNTWIGQYNNLRAAGGDIVMGNHCLVSQFCSLIASNHSTERGLPMSRQGPATDREGVVVEDDVWLGAGATILPGVKVGQGAVVAAGSVVNRNIPAFEVWAGVPAHK
jgi:acetyltransferase-like isoleucine patch superfamily enzyme